jgi:hypothetical protein
MYIILQTFPSDIDEVLNVFYCEDITIVRNWVRQYIETEIKSLEFCPGTQGLKNITYELNDADKNIELIKKYKRVSKGYIYNSSERIVDIIYSISILEFDSNKCVTGLISSNNWDNFNTEINKRVLRQLDKESLFQVFMKLQQRIDTKTHWNKTEYTGLVTETVKNFKKQLYSSITKKMKRSSKQHKNNVPDNFNSTRLTCKLEANKK